MKRMIIGAALAAVTLLPVAPAHSAPVDPVFPRGLPYAIAEDGCVEGVKRCVWDARSQGNGTGRSLLFTRHRGEYLAKRIPHRRAALLHSLYCERRTVTCEGYWD